MALSEQDKQLEAAGDIQMVKDVARLAELLYTELRDGKTFREDQAFVLTQEAIGPIMLRVQRKRAEALARAARVR